jgi:hypothetical protein
VVFPGEPEQAAAGLRALLDDAQRRTRMSLEGAQRMGKPGGALAIARAIAERLP